MLKKILTSSLFNAALNFLLFSYFALAFLTTAGTGDRILYGLLSLFTGATLVFFVWMLQKPVLHPLNAVLAQTYTWLLWRFTGFRKVDMTALPQFIEDGKTYHAIPLDLFLAKDGTIIITQAMVPAPEADHLWLKEDEPWTH